MIEKARFYVFEVTNCDLKVTILSLNQFGIINESPKKKRFSRYVAMGILREFHGIKVGSQLMERAVVFCRNQNVKRIELTVVKDNEKAVNLYKNFGFEIEGIKKDSLYINEIFVDEYYMAKIF